MDSSPPRGAGSRGAASEGPTVSVIIPCYNSAAYVGATIESVLAQTSPAEEIIVIDDGSRDESAAVLRAYAGRVTVLAQANAGVSAARNHGIERATGDYLLFLDADDLLVPDAIARLRGAAAAAPGAVVLMGWVEFGDCIKGERGPHVLRIDSFFPQIIRGNFGPNHTRLVPRRTAIAAGGFPPGMPIYEDWHFWTRVALLDTPLVALEYVGAEYRRHDSSCLAAPRELAVAGAYVTVAALQCERIARRADLLQQYGDELFWSGWTAFERGRRAGVPGAALEALAERLDRIVREGPVHLRRTSFARLARVLGFRRANRLRGLLVASA